jgi:hypothetical protein
MKKTVHIDADGLIRLAECLVTTLAEIGIPARTEAQLRASIAGTRFAISRYSVLVTAAQKHSIAASFLNEARKMRDDSTNRLCRRVRGIIAQLTLPENDLSRAADQLLSVGA